MFYNRCFSKMKRKLRPTKSLYKLENEQVNFLLEEIDKNLEEYKKKQQKQRQTASRSKKKDCTEQKIVTNLLQKKINS